MSHSHRADGPGGKGESAGGEQAQQRHEHIVGQGVGNGLESAADDDAHRQIHHIAPGNELAEFGQKAGGFLMNGHDETSQYGK